ncbi:CRISPR-associated endonuclease Cas2 [Corynebacterium sp. HS2168-gen11]|uniref:CRISPR-associated endonuclease Cas2 n=1 Tax=Corynebacterium sp. HS2168-gen11 TaxID=2974027 RepID=UPI00216AC108|nr:CRISPR-associated endonuclease Cas2 [Corynebacterium sp. HS2168-gen11]MCS4535310.1 CRISPR-associated endonuclease Cas2 [Corynebacterium sp. HS2168-gen11]
MWCVVMFDLPVATKRERKEATRFRNSLLDLGFARAQFSVYVQYLPLASRLHSIVKTIKYDLPVGGDIRIMCVTDTQWSKTIRFSAQQEVNVEDEPSQLVIF